MIAFKNVGLVIFTLKVQTVLFIVIPMEELRVLCESIQQLGNHFDLKCRLAVSLDIEEVHLSTKASLHIHGIYPRLLWLN